MASIKSSVYDIVRRPRITEKTTVIRAMENSVVFDVHPDANKSEIQNSIEKIFSVKVKSVRTLNISKKAKRVSAKKSAKSGTWKKAYVTLEQGSKIDLIEGL